MRRSRFGAQCHRSSSLSCVNFANLMDCRAVRYAAASLLELVPGDQAYWTNYFSLRISRTSQQIRWCQLSGGDSEHFTCTSCVRLLIR